MGNRGHKYQCSRVTKGTNGTTMKRKRSYSPDSRDPVESECGNFPLQCLNGGECVKKSWRRDRFPVPIYACSCADGFRGKQCQYKMVEYSTEPIPQIGTTNLVIIGILAALLMMVSTVLLYKCIRERRSQRKQRSVVVHPRKLEKVPPHMSIEIPDEPKLRQMTTTPTDQVRRRSRCSKDLSILEENSEDLPVPVETKVEISPAPIVIRLPPPKSRHLSHVEVQQRSRQNLGNSGRLASLQESFYPK